MRNIRTLNLILSEPSGRNSLYIPEPFTRVRKSWTILNQTIEERREQGDIDTDTDPKANIRNTLLVKSDAIR